MAAILNMLHYIIICCCRNVTVVVEVVVVVVVVDDVSVIFKIKTWVVLSSKVAISVE